jgi:hypothetical protein
MATIIKASGTATDLTLPILTAPLVLDTIASVIDRTYSLARKLRSAYTGPLVKVRRSSDSAVLDIGTTALGVLDEGALLAFAGAGDAFVNTFYDQGPSAKHLTQATAAAQAKIVASGVVVKLGGKPAASFDGVDDAYVGTSPALFANGSASFLGVFNAPAQASQRRIWTESQIELSGNQYGLINPDGAGGTRPAKGWPIMSGIIDQTTMTPQPAIDLYNGVLHQATSVDTGAAISQWVDGAADVAAAAYARPAGWVPNRFTLGGVTRSGSLAPALWTFGEGIWLKGAMSSVDRLAVQTAQKSFFGTP